MFAHIGQKSSGQNPQNGQKSRLINKLEIQGIFNSNFNINLRYSLQKVESYMILGFPNYELLSNMWPEHCLKTLFRGWIDLLFISVAIRMDA